MQEALVMPTISLRIVRSVRRTHDPLQQRTDRRVI
jgi:hypothetical protein